MALYESIRIVSVNKLEIGDQLVKYAHTVQPDGSHVLYTVASVRELKTQRVVTATDGRTFRYHRSEMVRRMSRSPI